MNEIKEPEVSNLEIICIALKEQNIPKLIEIRDNIWVEYEIYKELADNSAYLGLETDLYKFMKDKSDESLDNYRFLMRNIPQTQG